MKTTNSERFNLHYDIHNRLKHFLSIQWSLSVLNSLHESAEIETTALVHKNPRQHTAFQLWTTAKTRMHSRDGQTLALMAT